MIRSHTIGILAETLEPERYQTSHLSPCKEANFPKCFEVSLQMDALKLIFCCRNNFFQRLNFFLLFVCLCPCQSVCVCVCVCDAILHKIFAQACFECRQDTPPNTLERRVVNISYTSRQNKSGFFSGNAPL